MTNQERWIEVKNTLARRSNKSHSRANLDIRDWVLAVLDRFRGYFGNEMSQRVAVVSSYRRQVEEYNRVQLNIRQTSLASDKPIGSDAMATIRTVDSAQGGEWDVVLLDLVSSSADKVQDLGHIYDEHRACVA